MVDVLRRCAQGDGHVWRNDAIVEGLLKQAPSFGASLEILSSGDFVLASTISECRDCPADERPRASVDLEAHTLFVCRRSHHQFAVLGGLMLPWLSPPMNVPEPVLYWAPMRVVRVLDCNSAATSLARSGSAASASRI